MASARVRDQENIPEGKVNRRPPADRPLGAGPPGASFVQSDDVFFRCFALLVSKGRNAVTHRAVSAVACKVGLSGARLLLPADAHCMPRFFRRGTLCGCSLIKVLLRAAGFEGKPLDKTRGRPQGMSLWGTIPPDQVSSLKRFGDDFHHCKRVSTLRRYL